MSTYSPYAAYSSLLYWSVFHSPVFTLKHAGELSAALKLLSTATELYPDFDKLWMMSGQIELQKDRLDAARNAFNAGLKKCPNSIALWILTARIESEHKQFTKAR